MKAALLAFSFVFVFFTEPSVITGRHEPVFDSHGNYVVFAGGGYFVRPFRRGTGGGLTLSSTNHTCPLDVVQEVFETDSGKPVIFSHAVSRGYNVWTDTDLNIQNSDVQSTCGNSNVWRPRIVSSGVWVISSGVEGNPSADTLVNGFKIWRTRDRGVYKLAFCPTVCKRCMSICDELGIYRGEDGKRHLALGDGLESFPVIFERVSPYSIVSSE